MRLSFDAIRYLKGIVVALVLGLGESEWELVCNLVWWSVGGDWRGE